MSSTFEAPWLSRLRSLSLNLALCLSLAAGLSLSLGQVAEAKRLGGGKSVGQQSSNVKRDATPPQAAPAAAGATAGATGAAAGAAGAAAKKPWGAMLGGVAAGLGLAWLASSLGLGAAFANFLLVLLLLVVVAGVVMFFLRKRAGANNAAPYAMQGAGAAADVGGRRDYSPSNVGNDASARPWERNSMSFEAPQGQQPSNAASGAAVGAAAGAASGSMIGSRLAPAIATGWSIPEGFDQTGFLTGARNNFVLLQAAWDRADVGTLRSMMTDHMLEEIKAQLSERETSSNGAQNHTEVAMLDAKLLGVEDVGQGWMASVEFSGMIREDASAGPQPFREVWNMTKSKGANAGWLVAGVQALH
jgi:predicted lipid-binding transport protein (Tim44 family)